MVICQPRINHELSCENVLWPVKTFLSDAILHTAIKERQLGSPLSSENEALHLLIVVGMLFIINNKGILGMRNVANIWDHCLLFKQQQIFWYNCDTRFIKFFIVHVLYRIHVLSPIKSIVYFDPVKQLILLVCFFGLEAQKTLQSWRCPPPYKEVGCQPTREQ